ncbi:MAG: ABC transporter permease [Rickettsiaceae bacterium]|nr:ABC transporter permease [Rickettsiaceae bacterium]
MLKRQIFSKTYIQSLIILTEASIFRQHKNSFLGSVWGVVQPFIHIMIISYVFSFLLHQPAETLVTNLVASVSLWNFIVNSSVSSTKSLFERSDILKKVYIQKTLLPVTDTLVHLYTFVYSFIAMYSALIIIYPSHFSLSVLFVPIVVLPAIISTIAVGIAFAYITPYIMDVPHIITVILNAVYWAVPIIYPYEMVPESKRWIFEINPLFHLIRPLQLLLSDKAFPDPIYMIKALVTTLILCLISYLFVRKLSRNVIYYL